VFRTVQPGVARVEQGVDVAVRDRKDGAAPAAVGAIGAAHGNEFFPAETGDAVAALAGNDLDGGFVYEFHGEYILMKKKALLKSRAFSAAWLLHSRRRSVAAGSDDLAISSPCSPRRCACSARP